MNQTDLIILNFTEIRRKSVKLWKALPEEFYHWKPDEKAMTAIEMIRHVLEADYGWNIIINRSDMSNYKTPWNGIPFMSVDEEIKFAEPIRENFLKSVSLFSENELEHTQIVHPGNGELKPLGQYLLRIGYHESVHAGHFLSYLRAMGIDRPQIWD
ncbi:DinB family protein [Flavobacterium sp. J27]|uniref:DinB family protein n=1 Tax=Flavobacterium sp. J27 TaxID=2060419 RepID=UPI00103191BB|nr:DinB family protein [Flavobacterium sp. J27]